MTTRLRTMNCRRTVTICWWALDAKTDHALTKEKDVRRCAGSSASARPENAGRLDMLEARGGAGETS